MYVFLCVNVCRFRCFVQIIDLLTILVTVRFQIGPVDVTPTLDRDARQRQNQILINFNDLRPLSGYKDILNHPKSTFSVCVFRLICRRVNCNRS